MTKKLHFLILSRPDPFVDRILTEFGKQPLFAVQTLDSAPLAMDYIRKNKIQCLILNLESFGFRQVRLIEQVRELEYKFQILVFAKKVNDLAAKVTETLTRVVIFGSDSIEVNRDLIGLCSRFIVNDKPPVRQSARKTTRQRVTVERFKKRNIRFAASLQNMSEKGAFLDFKNAHLEVNEEIRLIFHLEEVKKTHTIQAKVAWIGVSKTGGLTAGLEFAHGSRRSLRVF